MRYVADKVLDGGDMSASITSEVIDVRLQYGFSLFAVWTGTPAGTLKMQCSPDGIGQWTDIPSLSAAVSGAGSYFTNQQWQFYPYVRIVYTRTSGSGTLNCWFTGKGG